MPALFAYRAVQECPSCGAEADMVYDGTTAYASTGMRPTVADSGWQTADVQRYGTLLQTGCTNLRAPCGFVLTFDLSEPGSWVAITPDLGRLLAHGVTVPTRQEQPR